MRAFSSSFFLRGAGLEAGFGLEGVERKPDDLNSLGGKFDEERFDGISICAELFEAGKVENLLALLLEGVESPEDCPLKFLGGRGGMAALMVANLLLLGGFAGLRDLAEGKLSEDSLLLTADVC